MQWGSMKLKTMAVVLHSTVHPNINILNSVLYKQETCKKHNAKKLSSIFRLQPCVLEGALKNDSPIAVFNFIFVVLKINKIFNKKCVCTTEGSCKKQDDTQLLHYHYIYYTLFSVSYFLLCHILYYSRNETLKTYTKEVPILPDTDNFFSLFSTLFCWHWTAWVPRFDSPPAIPCCMMMRNGKISYLLIS